MNICWKGSKGIGFVYGSFSDQTCLARMGTNQRFFLLHRDLVGVFFCAEQKGLNTEGFFLMFFGSEF